MDLILKSSLYEKIHESSDGYNDLNDWLLALRQVDEAPEIKVGSAEFPKAELTYTYLIGDEKDRTNFTMVCTHCGKIFECRDRSESEFLLSSFKHCFECGAEFVKEDTNERVSQD